jgi:hypothetical protein
VDYYPSTTEIEKIKKIIDLKVNFNYLIFNLWTLIYF